MTIRTDRRQIQTQPRPDLHRAARVGWRAALEHELRQAELFAGILDSREYVEQGSSTVVEYARRLGYHGGRAIVQARLGQAIRLRPELGARLRSRAICIENAEAIARAIADPETRELEDWLQLAENCELQSLRNFIDRRIEEAKQQEPELTPVQLHLTREDANKVERVRRIASKLARMDLTRSQGVVVALNEFLERHDPERKTKRARLRAGPAPAKAGPRLRVRYVPKAVEHMVRERARHRCEVPGCTCTTGLELCHRRWWSRGGAHHPRNIVLLCHRHHVLFDSGRLACVGFSEEGRPVFRLPDGEVIRPRTRPP